MHGRLKVRTTAEQQEAKRKEREKKLKIYNAVVTKIFEKRRAGEKDEESLALTRQILEANPDFYSLWNIRKEVFLHLKESSPADSLQQQFEEELQFLVVCLKVNPKSYGVWQHRCFVLDTMPRPDWTRELQLCSEFLKMDERNFHCWDYRRFVVRRSGVSAESEFEFTTSKVEETISNYSAWHYRSKLLPLVHPDPSSPHGVTEEALSNEYNLFQNAVYTDPNDQSAWIYHRWLLGRGKRQQQILHLQACRAPCRVMVSLANHVQVGKQDGLILEINGESRDCSWLNQLGKTSYSTLWIASGNIPDGGHVEVKVTLTSQGQAMCSKKVTLEEGEREKFVSNMNAGSLFRKAMSDVQRDVLEEQLHVLEDLNQEEEGKNKWALLSLVMLGRALGPLSPDQQSYLSQLCAVDLARTTYYRDLKSRFLMEDCIEALPALGDRLQLQSRGLTAVYHTSLLPCIRLLDLSANMLTSLGDLSHLQSLEVLLLDDNGLRDCKGLERLSALTSLSLRSNVLTSVEALRPLQHCPMLSSLDLENNLLCEDNTWSDQVLELLPNVKLHRISPGQE